MTNSKEYLKGATVLKPRISNVFQRMHQISDGVLTFTSDRRSDKTIRFLSHRTRYRVSDGVYQQLPERGAGGSRHAVAVESSEDRLCRALELYVSSSSRVLV